MNVNWKFISILYNFYFFGYALGNATESTIQAITVKDCGTSIIPQKSIESIVGGNDTERGSYPWMVALETDHGEGIHHECGGSVLNENWIITAAHCINESTKPELLQIRVGLYKLSDTNADTVQTIKISKFVLHEEYDNYIYENDIALLKTAKPINIAGSKGYVNGICLPTSKNDPTGSAKVIGWGRIVQGGNKSDTLKEVVVPMVSREDCNMVYDGITTITDTMICAGETGRDSCQYDSGGPFFQTNNKGVSTLIGIVSSGNGCAQKSFPGVYTKVSSFLDWIEKTVSN